ncbi:protein of unknown function [Ruminococcaceae bacterium BL-4]|nr:protein of unknown function [Ruminococcaceae bacterium BL-4]
MGYKVTVIKKVDFLINKVIFKSICEGFAKWNKFQKQDI